MYFLSLKIRLDPPLGLGGRSRSGVVIIVMVEMSWIGVCTRVRCNESLAITVGGVIYSERRKTTAALEDPPLFLGWISSVLETVVDTDEDPGIELKEIDRYGRHSKTLGYRNGGENDDDDEDEKKKDR